MSNAKIDENREKTAIATDTDGLVKNLLVDPVTGRLLIEIEAVLDPVSSTLNKESVDDNYENISLGVGDDAEEDAIPLHIDNRNGLVFCDVLVE